MFFAYVHMTVRLNSMAVGEEGVLDQSADAVVTPPDTAPLEKQTLAYGLSGLIIPAPAVGHSRHRR